MTAMTTPDLTEARRMADRLIGRIELVPLDADTEQTVLDCATMLRDLADTLEAARAQLADMTAAPELLETAQAVVARWDSPDWKDGRHTGEFIHALRQAIATATKE